MKGTIIFIGKCGYIQIGYQPQLVDNELEFKLRVVIKMDDTWMLLDKEELGNFFIALRKHEECRNCEGADPYLPSDDEDFPATFFIEQYNSSRIVTYVNYNTQKESVLAFPNVEAMCRVLEFEHIILGHVFEKFMFRNQFGGELDEALEKIVKQCKNVSHLKWLAANTPDRITVELAANFYSFFCAYWHGKNGK